MVECPQCFGRNTRSLLVLLLFQFLRGDASTFPGLQDISTPDFSTPNFNQRTFQPWILQPQTLMGLKSPGLKSIETVWGWRVHSKKSRIDNWGWKVRGWNVLQPFPGLQQLMVHLMSPTRFHSLVCTQECSIT